MHASLDAIDENFWNTQLNFLKNVDKFNDLLVSAFVTFGRVKFILLHDPRNEENLKNFFQDLYELYIKIQMNPFFNPTAPITSQSFDQRVKGLARKYF